MIIAIPLENNKLSEHFGHCHSFALVHVNDDTKSIEKTETLDAPAHEPGSLPQWLAEKKANIIICSGIGPRAVDLLNQNGIQVVTGAPVDTPDALVNAYLSGSLKIADNVCDH